VPESNLIGARLWPDRYKIAGQLLAMHAISPGDAVTYTPQTPSAAVEFKRMQARGIVREAIRGHYWLDWAAYNAETAARENSVTLVAGLGALAIAAALMLFMYLRG
jgi:hypothetical protein